MRRKDREITDINEIKNVISKCSCCRLGLSDNGKIYIVPMNYGWEENNGVFTFYFHSSKTGRKIDLINKNCYAAIELDCDNELMVGVEACDYSEFYKSIIGEGNISVIDDSYSKLYALNKIMFQNMGKGDWKIPALMLKNVFVFKLETTSLSCKEHNKPKM